MPDGIVVPMADAAATTLAPGCIVVRAVGTPDRMESVDVTGDSDRRPPRFGGLLFAGRSIDRGAASEGAGPANADKFYRHRG